MSKTGRYIYDLTLKQVVKISDTPCLESALSATAAYWKEPHYDPIARQRFETKGQKKAWMAKHNVREISTQSWGNPLRGLAESGRRTPRVFV